MIASRNLLSQCCGLALAALLCAPGAAQTSAPATDQLGPIDPDLGAALAPLSAAERMLADEVADGSRSVREPFLYVLLRRAAMTPEAPETLERADRPAYQNLLTQPARYRASLVAMDLYLWRIQRFEGLSHTRWWGDRPAWWADGSLDPGGTEPVIVILTALPEGVEEGAHLDDPPFRRVAGLFYKTTWQRRQRVEPGQEPGRQYPVVVASMALRTAAPASRRIPGQWIGMIALLAGLLIALMVIKRRMARPGPSRRRPRGPAEQPGDEDDSPTPVDPELVEQVRRFQQDQQEDRR